MGVGMLKYGYHCADYLIIKLEGAIAKKMFRNKFRK